MFAGLAVVRDGESVEEVMGKWLSVRGKVAPLDRLVRQRRHEWQDRPRRERKSEGDRVSARRGLVLAVEGGFGRVCGRGARGAQPENERQSGQGTRQSHVDDCARCAVSRRATRWESRPLGKAPRRKRV